MKPLRFVVLFLLAAGGIMLGWRWASRHYSLPCPTWLAGSLTSRWMDRLAGTQATLNRMGLHPGQRVHELGPGPGRLLIPAARRVLLGGEVVGLDIQPGMVERLKHRAAQAGVANLTVLLGDAAQPHFSPESFDLVYLCTVLGEIPDRDAALRQAYTALKPGGQFSITEIFPDPHYQSPASVQQLAESAGFRLAEIHGPWYFFTANFVKG